MKETSIYSELRIPIGIVLNAKNENIIYSGRKKHRNEKCVVCAWVVMQTTGTQAIMDLHIFLSVVWVSLYLFSALKHTNKQPLELIIFA